MSMPLMINNGYFVCYVKTKIYIYIYIYQVQQAEYFGEVWVIGIDYRLTHAPFQITEQDLVYT